MNKTFQQQLREFVESNPKLVYKKDMGNGLFVLKYSRKVFVDSLWNVFLEECRGTVIDKDFNLITNPFRKIYNFGVEENSPVIGDDEIVTAYRKVNGFMAALTWYNDDILVSTTGSITSNFVGYAKEMMLTHMSWDRWQEQVKLKEGYTLLFEVVHPKDPHIIPEKAGMYFLGERKNEWCAQLNGFGSDTATNWCNYTSDVLKCHEVGFITGPVRWIVKCANSASHEGYVMYHEDGRTAKIKTKHYLIQKAYARKKDISSLDKYKVDEEYYPLMAHIKANLEHFNSLVEQDRLQFMREFLEK